MSSSRAAHMHYQQCCSIPRQASIQWSVHMFCTALHIKLPASIHGMDPTVSLPNLASNDNHIGHVDWTAATCTWHISTHFWCCENAIPWHNLASNETDAEHIELTEYGYEDIESCIRKQTLISNLLWQPTVQRLKSDNVKVNCLHHFWKE